MRNTKFKYGDQVRVIKGFHREREGKVEDCIEYMFDTSYLVLFGSWNHEWISEKALTKIGIAIETKPKNCS